MWQSRQIWKLSVSYDVIAMLTDFLHRLRQLIYVGGGRMRDGPIALSRIVLIGICASLEKSNNLLTTPFLGLRHHLLQL